MAAIQPHPYAELTPTLILDAVEREGYRCSGHLLALNSYENRVFQIGLEDAPPLVAKFYRPGRWSDAAILEEHAFALELAAHEIPIVAPFTNAHEETLFLHAGFRFALYPRHGGHAPPLDDSQNLETLGRFIGRIHAIGSLRRFQHRGDLDVHEFGWEPRRYLLESDHLPGYLSQQYADITQDLLQLIETRLAQVAPASIRLHGDLHIGNILWRDASAHLVDLDDSRNGPAIQDLWMLLAGEYDSASASLDSLLRGYTQFQDFDPTQLSLIEPLRSLRMIHYAAWLARRWDDPAFPSAFPWFGNPRYWETHLQDLREQRAKLDEEPLRWPG